jgi:hypothetical protein
LGFPTGRAFLHHQLGPINKVNQDEEKILVPKVGKHMKHKESTTWNQVIL